MTHSQSWTISTVNGQSLQPFYRCRCYVTKITIFEMFYILKIIKSQVCFLPIRPTRISMHPPIPCHNSLIETTYQHITHTTTYVSFYSNSCKKIKYWIIQQSFNVTSNVGLLKKWNTYRGTVHNRYSSLCNPLVITVIWKFISCNELWTNKPVKFLGFL